jgi:hypothetical protein
VYVIDVPAGNFQRGLVDESGIVGTQTGKHNRVVMVAVYGTPCEIPPCKQKHLQYIAL